MIAGTFRLPPVEAAVMIAGVDAKVRIYRPDASADAAHLGAPPMADTRPTAHGSTVWPIVPPQAVLHAKLMGGGGF